MQIMFSSNVIEGRFKRAGTFFPGLKRVGPVMVLLFISFYRYSVIRVRVWMCTKSTDSWSFV